MSLIIIILATWLPGNIKHLATKGCKNLCVKPHTKLNKSPFNYLSYFHRLTKYIHDSNNYFILLAYVGLTNSVGMTWHWFICLFTVYITQ